MEDQEESDLTGVESASHQVLEPSVEVVTEGSPPVASGGDTTVSPEEDDLLTGDQTHTEDQSPTSDAASMTREMAKLQVHSPPHQEPSTGGPHNRSRPSSTGY